MPKGVKELVLFVANAGQGHSVVDWSVAGLKPSGAGIAAGRLPAGAIPGRNASGKTSYGLCPAKGAKVEFGVALYGLPGHLDVKPGFNALSILEHLSGDPNVALLLMSYQRR